MKTSTITRRSRCLGLAYVVGALQSDGSVAWPEEPSEPMAHGTAGQLVKRMDAIHSAAGVCLARFWLFIGRRRVTQENWRDELQGLVLFPGLVKWITLETED